MKKNVFVYFFLIGFTINSIFFFIELDSNAYIMINNDDVRVSRDEGENLLPYSMTEKIYLRKDKHTHIPVLYIGFINLSLWVVLGILIVLKGRNLKI